MIDRLHTTAESHQRVLLVEVMGRHAGWIALHAGLASGAHVTLVPEEPFDVDEVCRLVSARFERGDTHVIGVVAEGATPAAGHDGRSGTAGSTSTATAGSPASPSSWARSSSGAPARRSAPPCSATSSAAARRRPSTASWPPASACTPRSPRTRARHGQMVALRGTEIELVPLEKAVATLKTVPPAAHGRDRRLHRLSRPSGLIRGRSRRETVRSG